MKVFRRAGACLALGVVTALVPIVALPGVAGATAPSITICEFSPWSSTAANTPPSAQYAADWFELRNSGASAVDITGWKVDDDSNSFASAIALAGVTSIAPGQSVVFIEGTAATANLFKTAWFGGSVPPGFTIGTYSGSGIGLGNGGDTLNIFGSGGNRITGVTFGASTTGQTFENTAGLGTAVAPYPAVSTLSVAGTNLAFHAATEPPNEVGSPGLCGTTPPPDVPEVPLPLMLSLSAIAVLGVGYVLKRRRTAASA